MGPHDGGIDEHLRGQLTAVLLHVLPELLPDGTGFPPAKAVIDRIPVAKLSGHIAPGNTRAGDIQPRFKG